MVRYIVRPDFLNQEWPLVTCSDHNAGRSSKTHPSLMRNAHQILESFERDLTNSTMYLSSSSTASGSELAVTRVARVSHNVSSFMNVNDGPRAGFRAVAEKADKGFGALVLTAVFTTNAVNENVRASVDN